MTENNLSETNLLTRIRRLEEKLYGRAPASSLTLSTTPSSADELANKDYVDNQGGLGDHTHDGSSGSGGPSLAPEDVTVADTGTAPSSAGEIRNNNGAVEAYSGGAVRNLSNVTPGANTHTHDGSSDSGGGTISPNEINNDDYHEKVVSQSGSTGNLDLSTANYFHQTITGNISFSFNNASGTPAGNHFVLVVEQDGTGGHTISWPSSVEWDSGSAPSLSNNANDKHMLTFTSYDGGSTWIGIEGPRQIA